MRRFLSAALASATIALNAVSSVPAGAQPVGPTQAPTPSPPLQQPPMTMVPMPAGVPALDARYLRSRRSLTGYTLSGQALVKDACTAARFDPYRGTIYPPQFNLMQYRRPGTTGMLCAPRRVWVIAQPRSVVSSAPPRYVMVHTTKGNTRVPIAAAPTMQGTP